MIPQHCVIIHASQFPEQVEACLRESLSNRRIDPKFHYESRRQARHWLKLHEHHSPARQDPAVQQTYADAFAMMAESMIESESPIQVIGLGCGGGQKEAALIHCLASTTRRDVSFTAVDVSPSLVLTSLTRVHQRSKMVRIPAGTNHAAGMVCDFGNELDPFPFVDDLRDEDAAIVFTFFGMLPNFEPEPILDRLNGLLRAGDSLLVSANLSPGDDYLSGVRQVLPQYDNELTRAWLMSFLVDLGASHADGALEWGIEDCPLGSELLRMTASYRFARACTLQTITEDFRFERGERLRLFVSYRHTPERLHKLLAGHGLAVTHEWISSSGQEGVFMVSKA